MGLANYLHNKRVLVTGACGTVGKELVRQLVYEHNVTELVGLDNNESELFFVNQKYSGYPNVDLFLGDVRDKDKMTRAFKNVDVVFHTAAFKHVTLCECSPSEAIQTNITGVENVISAAIDNHVGKVVFTSSDKAVNPTNVMGTTKLMGERLMSAANSSLRDENTIFYSVRFGNILGSRGSVIPIFREQIKSGDFVTLTDPTMSRFIMSIQDAVDFILESGDLAKGGEVFITKMHSINISDLAEVMINELVPVFGHSPDKIKIKIIGSRSGEKKYEELLSDEETHRSVELARYYVLLPAFQGAFSNINYNYSGVINTKIDKPYNSATQRPLNKEALGQFLISNNLLSSSE